MKIDWPNRGHSYVSSDLNGLQELLLSEESLTASKKVSEFEEVFRKKFNLKSCHATMSCAHALDIIGKICINDVSDEVIIPAHTYCASAIAFARTGAKIVWGDIDPRHLTLTYSEIEKLTTKNTKVIVVVHLYGCICPEIEQIANFAKKHDIILVEDCAQCIGAKLNNYFAGSFGDFSTFSFHAQKNMTTLGEGGMLANKDLRWNNKIKALRLNGHKPFENQTNYWLPAMTNVTDQSNKSWPMKASITEAQAIVGINVLERLNDMNDRRKVLATKISNSLTIYEEIMFQDHIETLSHCNHLLPIKISSKKISRDEFIKRLFKDYGIKCVIQYYPLYKYELFIKKGLSHKGLTNTEDFYNNMVSLPFNCELDEKKCEYLIKSISNVMERN